MKSESLRGPALPNARVDVRAVPGQARANYRAGMQLGRKEDYVSLFYPPAKERRVGELDNIDWRAVLLRVVCNAVKSLSRTMNGESWES
jgi:hypothetical protein